MTVALVDLGYGNLRSITNAFERLGASIERTADPARIGAARRVVLPGVGSAGYAMDRIEELRLRDALTGLSQPLLGICLGMQLLFEASEEDAAQCLGLVPGRVRGLPPAPGLPVPHMGWSRLEVRGECGLNHGDYLYFAHSFVCDDGPHSLAWADHGGLFPAVVRRGNLFGAQFHPERSGAAGRRFLQAFLSC